MPMPLQRGFTLIELLVVISIIGILSGIVLASLGSARTEGQEVTALAQLKQAQNALVLLETHTGKTIRGCPLTGGWGSAPVDEISLNDPQAGLYTAPTDTAPYGFCQWTAQDIAEWQGPYIESPLDPWGNEYWFDRDYDPRRHHLASVPENNGVGCDNPYPGDIYYRVFASGGKNELNGAWTGGAQDCDDVFLILGPSN